MLLVGRQRLGGQQVKTMARLTDELKRRELATTAFTDPQVIERNLARAREEQLAGRESFLTGTLGGALARAGVSGQSEAIAGARQRLLNESVRSLRARKLQESRGNLQRTYDLAYQRAKNAGLAESDAVQYARAISKEQVEQAFKAEQAELDRVSGRKQEDIADVYARQGALISSEPSYEDALTRALFGLGGQIGTGLILSRIGRQQQQSRSDLSNIVSDQGSLRIGSGFSPYSFYGGRQPISFNPANLPNYRDRYQFGGFSSQV